MYVHKRVKQSAKAGISIGAMKRIMKSSNKTQKFMFHVTILVLFKEKLLIDFNFFDLIEVPKT